MYQKKFLVALFICTGIFCTYFVENIFAGSINVTSLGVSVNGTITAKEVRVTDVGWADYVFKSDYPLLPLESVDKFIKNNEHLPGVPSEYDVKKSGVNISEILSIQMQKIEELTLYLISLKKENDSLKERIAKLEKNKQQ